MKQIQMPADNFEKLKAIVTWYDQMPAFLEVGDRFHERISEEMDKLIPAIEEIDNDDYFSAGVEEMDGKLRVLLCSCIDPNDEFEIELIPV